MARFILTENNATTLSGDWVLDNIEAIQKELKKSGADKNAKAEISALDTAGAELLLEFERIDGLTPAQQSLLGLVQKSQQEFPASESRGGMLAEMFITTGKTAIAIGNDILDLIRFIGQSSVVLAQNIANPQRLRMKSVIRHVHETGVMAIPIVALIAFLISIVLAYQGAEQLKRFGAQIFAVNLVAVSVLREMGVLLTAIMIAGRSGSAFTAEIGVMKVNEEVDAMRIIGVKPFDFLVIPRLIALMIAMPLLTFIADLMGLLGGAIICFFQMGLSFETYIDRFQQAVSISDFWVGIVKAPVFAFFIAIVGCMRGMQVSGSAESVGKLTTTSVVQSIFLVLLLDALFSILFTKLGI